MEELRNSIFNSLKKINLLKSIPVIIFTGFIEIFCGPYLYTSFTQNYIKAPQKAITCLLLFYVVSEIAKFIESKIYGNYQNLGEEILKLSNDFVIKKIYGAEWSTIKEADHNKLKGKIMKYGTSIFGLIFCAVNGMLGIFSLIGNTIVLFSIFPYSMLMYLAVLLISYKFKFGIFKRFCQARPNGDQIKNLLLNEKVIEDLMFNKIIHHQKEESISQLLENDAAITELTLIQPNKRNNNFFDSLVMIIGLLLFTNMKLVNNIWIPGVTEFVPVENISVVMETVLMTYIIYTKDFSLKLFLLIPMYNTYHENKTLYNELSEELKKYTPRSARQIVTIDNETIIDEFSFRDLYYYITDGHRHFSLRSDAYTIFSFKSGDVCLVSGPTGAGKSKFFDIIGGIVSSKDYVVTLSVNNDSYHPEHLFESLTNHRVIRLQNDISQFKGSPFSIITGIINIQKGNESQNQNEKERDKKEKEEKDELVYEIIKMVAANDFIKRDQLHNVYKKKDETSGGQKARLETARALYEVFKSNPLTVILDEPDGAIHEDLKPIILQNIINYTKSKGIILIMSLHSNDLKRHLNFTHKININNGHITKG